MRQSAGSEYPTIAIQNSRAGWLFASPGLILLTLVIGVPLFGAVALAVSSYTFLHPHLTPFLGTRNINNIFHDPYFWSSLWRTVLYSFVTVAGELLLGMGIALLLNRKLRFKIIYYAILTIPMAMAPVSVALSWNMLLQPELGIVNQVLGVLGLPQPDWLGSPNLAFWTVALVDIWQQVSFVILILTAGLAALPEEPYEAATVDGASAFSQFFYITLPMLKPVLLVAAIIQMINEFRTYDLIYVMTKGGPGISTDVLSYFIYRRAFLGLSVNEADAASFGLLFVVLVLTIFLFRLIRSSEDSD